MIVIVVLLVVLLVLTIVGRVSTWRCSMSSPVNGWENSSHGCHYNGGEDNEGEGDDERRHDDAAVGS